MSTASVEDLKAKKCKPCEGEVAAVPAEEAERLLGELPGWHLVDGDSRIRGNWIARDFVSAMNFLHHVARLAEEEGHHPDLHLVGYRNVTVELTTHAIGGLSENDFILAAKIDELSIQLKRE